VRLTRHLRFGLRLTDTSRNGEWMHQACEVMVATRPQLKLVPKNTWLINALGAVFFLGVIIATVVTGTSTFPAVSASVVGVPYLLWFAVICVRPPSVRVYDDHLVIAQVARSRTVGRKDFCSVGLEQAQRVIGGESNSSNKHVFISYYDSGSLITVPAIWCDRSMGLLTQPEWQRFNAVLTMWAKGEKVAESP
jgi:hypothetical protein